MASTPASSGLYPNCDVTVWLRSCEKEVLEPIPGAVSGQIPKWLKGTLLRNGPGSLKVGDDCFEHLFDCSALLHRFAIDGGQVTYQSRFLQSETYKRNKAANRIVLTEFGTQAIPDPCRSIFQRVATVFFPNSENVSDNSMISVYPIGDEIFAFGEIPVIHKINPVNLETDDVIDVSNYISILHHTSHPHVMEDGTVYNLAMTLSSTGPQHSIVKFPVQDGKCAEKMFENAQIVGSVPARWPLHPSYMHTFGLTENFFIIVEQPLSISIGGVILTKLKNEPLSKSFRWYQEEKTRFSIISRTTGRLVQTCYSESFFYLHIINQYEIGDAIVIDICTYHDPEMLNCMYINAMKKMQENANYANMFRAKSLRFTLPLNPKHASHGQVVTGEELSNIGCETPRINYKFLGKQYRYFYAINSDVDAENPGTLVKIDIENKTNRTWCEPNCYPSEPIFVASPNPQFEDDGVVLAAIVWSGGKQNQVGLLVLDAGTFTELGRAVFDTESPVPKCLHGWFLNQAGV